jgi:signal transduction histidine kinase
MRYRLKNLPLACCVAIVIIFPLRQIGAEKIILTGNKEYPPLIFLENGKPKGIYPDIIRAMASPDFDAEIRLMEWQAAQDAVLHSSADALIGMAILNERRKKFDFTNSLLPHEFAIFVRRGDVSIQSFSDLKFKTVGVISGSVPVAHFKDDREINFKTIASYKEGFALLREGKVHALVLNEWVGTYILYNSGIENIIPVKSASVIGGPAAFAVRKGNTRIVALINDRLKSLRASGKLDEILERWQPHSMIIWPQAKLRSMTAAFVASTAALVLIILILWVFTLLRNLKRARLAEQKLRESHDLLGKLTYHVPGMIYQFKMAPDGKFSLSYTSEGVGILQEVSREDAMADFTLLERRVHPDDKDRFAESIMASATRLTPWNLEYRMVLPKQGIRWRRGESQPEKAPDGTIVWHGYLMDITEQKLREAQIAELSAKIIDLREKERAEISHELHDSVGQSLVILKLHLENKMKQLSEEQKTEFRELFSTIDKVLSTTREISRRLSPLHLVSLGLAGVIEDLCDQIRKSRNFRISLDIEAFARCVSEGSAIQVYRIVQEALTNIIKHSNADEIRIYAQQGEQSIRLVIADNGKNDLTKPAPGPGIGLQIMRERARIIEGTFRFRINSDGAQVEIELPKRFGNNPAVDLA